LPRQTLPLTFSIDDEQVWAFRLMFPAPISPSKSLPRDNVGHIATLKLVAHLRGSCGSSRRVAWAGLSGLARESPGVSAKTPRIPATPLFRCGRPAVSGWSCHTRIVEPPVRCGFFPKSPDLPDVQEDRFLGGAKNPHNPTSAVRKIRIFA